MDKVYYYKLIAKFDLAIALISFFILIVDNNYLFAIIILLFGVIGAVSFFALASAINEINSLKQDVGTLKYHIQNLENLPKDNKELLSFETWKCKKCGTLNKPGSKFCSNCSAKNK